MADIATRSEHRCCGGTLGFHEHESEALGLPARFALFRPGTARGASRPPALFCLAGLTCDETTFATKGNALRFAAAHGLMLVFPDTSPRRAGVPGEDEDWDLGTGAGFYLDATAEPWRTHYRMGSYVNDELPALVEARFGAAPGRRGIMGHSMGGHGALVLALRDPERWHSVSALAPIAHPAAVPWGHKAFGAYLGPDRDGWAAHDATLLLRAGHTHPTPILVDQGDADQFLSEQLRPDALAEAAEAAGQKLRLRRHAGYDHSYWFIQSVIEDHVAHHARLLRG
ncbi:S-formylglutathione hydrolase [Rhizosaccharibacter radicis]|uniref:S-formylglutathione hydrolase n=1 Tax=Rhizosaccharibacter radicis TaxID=2782605 RepID=A0ABT1VSK7_9PROT|nr:S-formylglutathione hydrolase [Acetobacteraceae bacterium KSS12]